MKINLNIWQHPASGETRIYVRGTNRDASKLWFGARADGSIQKHSVNIDGSAKYQGQTVYQKRDKDADTLNDVLARFGMQNQPFAALKTAVETNSLVEIEPVEAEESEDE